MFFRLQQTNLKLKFVTNTTKESKEVLYTRLSKIGFRIDRKKIFTSLSAARQLVEKRELRPFFMISDDALTDFDDINTNDPNCVVVGLAPDALNYENMTKALR